jgi:DNA-binding CsgD family transcriptional regulator
MLSQKAGDVMDVFLVPGIPLENSNSHRSIIPGFVNYGFGSEAYIVAFLMVELLGRLCSRTYWYKQVRRVSQMPLSSGCNQSFPRLPQQRLTDVQVDSLVQGYQAGTTMSNLARSFDLHRLTVAQHLKRRSVKLRQVGLRPMQVVQAVEMYRQGLSLATIGRRLSTSADTVRRELLRRGVVMRKPYRT